MNNTYLTLIICTGFISLFISSCGDDSTPANPTSGVIFSFDSISIWLQPGGVSEGVDSIYYSTENSGRVTIEFTLQSDADSNDHAIGYYGMYTNATPPVPYQPYIYSPVNEPFFTNLNFNSPGETYFAFSVRLNVNNSTTAHYVRLKNIKVTKQ